MPIKWGILNKLARSQKDKNKTHCIEMKNVTMRPILQNLNCSVAHGSWVFLEGNDSLGKAMFCDLCFSYIKPELGEIEPKFANNEVSFLGRGPTTYGHTLLDHLTCGVSNSSKEEIELIAKSVFSQEIYRHMDKDMPLLAKNDSPVKKLDLNEKDYMELAEANLMLQKRPAVIVDTCSKFYQKAFELGFRHSEAFLNAKKTIFWLTEQQSQPIEKLKSETIKSLKLEFNSERSPIINTH